MKCTTCGKFFRVNEPGSSWLFVPDSDCSYEEFAAQCKLCTDTHGEPVPIQNVKPGSCSGTVNPRGKS